MEDCVLILSMRLLISICLGVSDNLPQLRWWWCACSGIGLEPPADSAESKRVFCSNSGTKFVKFKLEAIQVTSRKSVKAYEPNTVHIWRLSIWKLQTISGELLKKCLMLSLCGKFDWNMPNHLEKNNSLFWVCFILSQVLFCEGWAGFSGSIQHFDFTYPSCCSTFWTLRPRQKLPNGTGGDAKSAWRLRKLLRLEKQLSHAESM